MTDSVRELFNRWEQVWHEGQYDLIPSCVGLHYVRHDEKGNRTVTRDEYSAELQAVHKDRPGIRVVVYDHSFTTDRAWFRFAFVWPDPTTGEKRSRAGMQSYLRLTSWPRRGSRCLVLHGMSRRTPRAMDPPQKMRKGAKFE